MLDEEANVVPMNKYIFSLLQAIFLTIHTTLYNSKQDNLSFDFVFMLDI